jgi:hypothetical protein
MRWATSDGKRGLPTSGGGNFFGTFECLPMQWREPSLSVEFPFARVARRALTFPTRVGFGGVVAFGGGGEGGAARDHWEVSARMLSADLMRQAPVRA